MPTQQNILVIKLGALGDFIQALGPMAAIRKAHSDAKITLLTTKPFKGFAEQCGYFDDIWLDSRPRLFGFSDWIALRNKLNAGNFTRIYDLQNNDRTSFYFRLLKNPRPEWVGIAKGASHRNKSPTRTAGHAFDGHAQTLGLAGIKDIKIDDLSWMKASVSDFPLNPPYVLLVTGSAPQHPRKRWPRYAELAKTLAAQGFQPVLLGAKSEAEINGIIKNKCPEALDLTGRTDLPQIATLARGAVACIGNDTGPVHIIAATDCPCVVLFSGSSNPVRHAPKGPRVRVVQKDNLDDLDVEAVMTAFNPR
jgi:ADP-heptose:LPS heptosyltransferase